MPCCLVVKCIKAVFANMARSMHRRHAISRWQFIADAEVNEFGVNIVTHELQPGERLLLCSDGLYEVLSDAEIAALLVGHSDEDLLNACKASRRAGGADAFSVIVLARQH